MAGKDAAWKATTSRARTTATTSSRSRRFPTRRKASRGPTTTLRPTESVFALDGGFQLGRALEPVALAQPLAGGLERLLVRDRRGDPAVPPDVTRGPHVGQQVGDFPLLGGELDRHVDGPVVEGDRLVGTLTDRDIVVRVVAEGKDPQTVTTREVASTAPVTVDPQQDLEEALRLMATHQVRRLPVVEEDGRVVGVLAQADVAEEAKAKKTGELVEEISKD